MDHAIAGNFLQIIRRRGVTDDKNLHYIDKKGHVVFTKSHLSSVKNVNRINLHSKNFIQKQCMIKKPPLVVS